MMDTAAHHSILVGVDGSRSALRPAARDTAGHEADRGAGRVRPHVVRERPLRGLQRESRGAQLLVAGSRGPSARTGMGLGSTSQALLHRSTCLVAVVRPAKEH
ncbi:MAG TPA: universal stress protein [Amycolatopsis sp.]|nr:universal stress protein [Amycolatopsis sp.]